MNIISIHPFHDAGIALGLSGSYHVLELERIFGERHFDLSRSHVSIAKLIGFVRNTYGVSIYDIGIVQKPFGSKRYDYGPFDEMAAQWTSVEHHLSHAAAAFYQSRFEQCLVFSYDGGGSDGYFRPFLCSRDAGLSYIGPGLPLNLGSAYSALAEPIREIQRSSSTLLPNAGKLMGLAAFGKTRYNWLESIKRFFLANTNSSIARLSDLPALGDKLGLDLRALKGICGDVACDYAATIQRAFEDLFMEASLPILENFPELPVCLSGGCALNVCLNERLARTVGRGVFVPPNPNDCGLALGAIFAKFPPSSCVQSAYCGIPLLDSHTLPSVAQHHAISRADPYIVAELLADGKIIGVARSTSEHGPRALGNRSILADPGTPNIQAKLNECIKFREGFRPYAPVVRLQDVNKYFATHGHNLEYMSFNPEVHVRWRDCLKGIVHVDGSARVQSLRRESNPWLYDVLTSFENIKGYGVLLNTSFNIRGRPLVATVADAMSALFSTALDYAVIEDYVMQPVPRSKAVELRDMNPSSELPPILATPHPLSGRALSDVAQNITS